MIAVHRDGAVLTIAFDRAEARNAISTAGWEALAAAARNAAADDAAVVLVTSAVSGIFSAGADLATLAPLVDDVAGRSAFRLRMHSTIQSLAALPMPVVAAIDGGCYGAAVAIALACDIVVVGDGATFATTPAKLGIGYPGSDVARLERRIGRGQAARMLFTAQPIGADEAARIGLADVRVPDAGHAATDLVAQIAANAPAAVRLLKRTLDRPTEVDAGFDAAFGSAEFLRGLAAFRHRER